MRFLLRWQHVATGSRREGRFGLLSVIEKLQGFELAAGIWENAVFAARVDGYRRDWLDELCLSGQVSWGRLSVKDMTLIWKLTLDNQPREMHNLFAPLIIGDLDVGGGAREIAVVAGISDNLYGIDIEHGTQLWKRHFDSTFDDPGRSGGPLCPGGQTATPEGHRSPCRAGEDTSTFRL